jgi:hypothetical protein
VTLARIADELARRHDRDGASLHACRERLRAEAEREGAGDRLPVDARQQRYPERGDESGATENVTPLRKPAGLSFVFTIAFVMKKPPMRSG